MRGKVLIIAGSDSGGGAGIQADIKTVTALGGFAMTAITAVTAQNTKGVSDIHNIPPSFVEEQIKVVLGDIGADVIKIGMLSHPEIISSVSNILMEAAPEIPIIVDPVMVAKGGASLLDKEATDALKTLIVPRALVLTPNIPEAETLTGMIAPKVEDAENLASALSLLGPKIILLKGGHRNGDRVVDLLMERGQVVQVYASDRIDTVHTHGTGCTLSSALAIGMAQGMTLVRSVERAREYVQEAIRTAPCYGSGHGPLNHAHTFKKF